LSSMVWFGLRRVLVWIVSVSPQTNKP
jgi:hypothetical protein